MYKINRDSNSIEPMEKKSFSSLKFNEREHLQEWIAKQPDALGEDLLIIQKEFSDWDDTKERLDLLALDKDGALVIIENKLDDSGSDVTWQALKYASYCSSLLKADIVEIYQKYLDKTGPGAKAEERISEFMNGKDLEEIGLNEGASQRIIFIAAKFRKEVTSTVLWLMNFNIRLQCFRVTPYAKDEELFLNIEQIIPVPDARDYMVNMAKKKQEETTSQIKSKKLKVVRNEFWPQLLQAMNNTSSDLFRKISPSLNHWISAASGVPGVSFDFVAIQAWVRIELYIERADKTENKFVFDQLESQQDAVQTAFGNEPLIWMRMDTNKACRIKAEKSWSIYDRDQWSDRINWMTENMCRLEKAMKEPLEQVKKKLRSGAINQADDT